MKIAFIDPCNKGWRGRLPHSLPQMLYPPLWPSILNALTPEKHERAFISHQRKDITEKMLSNYDLVALSVLTTTSKDAYEIGDMCKRVGTKCVMGGYHPYVLPEEAKAHCDAIIFGECETNWPKVLGDVESKELAPFYSRGLCRETDFVVPDFSIYKNWFYLKLPLEISRGCPNRCDFCGLPIYTGYMCRYRPLDVLRKDIETWKRNRTTVLTTPNLMANPMKTRERLNIIKEYNLRWVSPCDTTIGKSDETLKLTSESGCVALYYGLESISRESLLSVHKLHNIKSDYKELVKKTHDFGFLAGGSFVLGFDGDTKETVKNTVEFARDCDIDICIFFPLTPYPGTMLFDRLNREGRILTYDWERYDILEVIFQPKHFTPTDLLGLVVDANMEVNSWGNAFRKIFSRHFSGVPGGNLAPLFITLGLRSTAKQLKNVLKFKRESQSLGDRVEVIIPEPMCYA
ncbi:MAG: B12-binding domain-containing radical SAM protein, partial [Thermoplasmata archaeon]